MAIPTVSTSTIVFAIISIIVLAVFIAGLALALKADFGKKEDFIDQRPRIADRDLLITEVRAPRGDAFSLLVYAVGGDTEGKQYNCISSTTFTWMAKRYVLLSTMNGEASILLHIPIGSTKLVADPAVINIPNPNAQINALVNVNNDFILAARDDGIWKLKWNGMSFNGERILAATIGDVGDLVTIGLLVSEPTINHETRLSSSFAINALGLLQHYGYGSIDLTAITDEFVHLDHNEYKTVVRSHLSTAGKRITIRRTVFGKPFANEEQEVVGAEAATGLADQINPVAQPDKRRLNEVFDRKSNVSESHNLTIARQERVNLTRRKVQMISTYNPPKKRYYFIEMTNLEPFANNRLRFDTIDAYFMKDTIVGSLSVNMRDTETTDIKTDGRIISTYAKPLQTSILCMDLTNPTWAEVQGKRFWPPLKPSCSWHMIVI